MEFGEGVIVGRSLDALVVDVDLLVGARVVVDHHALAADDDHFADLVGVEPAAVHEGDEAVPEPQC